MSEHTSSNGKIKLTLTSERVGGNGKTIRTGTINVAGKTGSIDLFDSGDCSTDPKWLRENAPSSWSNAGDAAPLLVQAGFEGDFAPLFYTTIRVTAADDPTSAITPMDRIMTAMRISTMVKPRSLAVTCAVSHNDRPACCRHSYLLTPGSSLR